MAGLGIPLWLCLWISVTRDGTEAFMCGWCWGNQCGFGSFMVENSTHSGSLQVVLLGWKNKVQAGLGAQCGLGISWSF